MSWMEERGTLKVSERSCMISSLALPFSGGEATFILSAVPKNPLMPE